MRKQLSAVALAIGLAVPVACGPPQPPPSPISGVSSEGGEFVLTATVRDASGFVAYHCYATLPYDVALTDAKGVEYRAVTQAVATTYMTLLGSQCNPYFWRIRFWMECVPDCGEPTGLWTGAEPRRVVMPFKREPGRAKIRLHVEASYAGQPSEGQTVYDLPTILCGANPTNGVRTCLFTI